MLIVNSTVLLLTGLLGFLTFRRIVNPIWALKDSVETIAAGDYTKEVPFTEATDETGGLARSIQVLKQRAAVTEEQRWVKSNASKLTGDLQGAASLADFGQRLLSGLVPLLGGGVAGFYVFEPAEGQLRRMAAYGLAPNAQAGQAFGLGEGLAGQCALDRKVVTLSNLPPNYLSIASGLGTAAPAQAVAWPLISKDGLLGVIETAAFRAVDSREKALLEELLPVAALSLEVLQRNLRTRELLDKTQQQARQLEEQTEALTQSQQELQQINFMADSALDLTKAGYWHVPLDGSGWYNSSERAARIFGDLPSPDHRYTLEHWDEARSTWRRDAAAKVTAENFQAAVEGKIPVYDADLCLQAPGGRARGVDSCAGSCGQGAKRQADRHVRRHAGHHRLQTAGNGNRGGEAEGRGGHADEVDVPGEHEPRNPHADERHHRPVAPRAQDRSSTPSSAITSARSTTPARRCSAIINDILDFSKIEAGKLDIETTDFRLDEVISSVTTLTAQKAHEKGLEFLAARRAGHPRAPARRPAAARPDSDQLRQQRGQVHRTRRNPARHRAARTHRREGAAQVLRARHRHRHDAASRRRSCSSRSRRPTCPPRASTAARAWA